ncbi:PREDICTED: non-specific lipid-transfer protein-like [Lupinus angustifolius]|uniref:non-specific lipid-transfer protein-like n=1 Tax=Lupinus angustifolius TaxID=3871 RepID=UPI00092E7397|nr:PREDICTED: non-specific lipid-transfer protein-like [Lupinus angustifolius]
MKMARAITINCLTTLLAISLIILFSSSEAKVSISCPIVIQNIKPCSDFLLNGKDPSQECCNGIKIVSGEAEGQEDRTSICQCIKQGLSGLGTYDPKLIPQLPQACGLSMIVPPIDQNTDCSKINFMK